jgi:hypothetical protein
VSGQRFAIGDRVGFKDGVEQYGTISKNYATAVDVEVWNSETGQYDRHHVARARLWLDS